jgi:NhaA family Na+:H+ antiporter
VFLVALAVMDDLGAIIVIAVFYSTDISIPYLAGALGTFAALRVLGRFRVMSLLPYLIGGALMWYLMLRSGVHATIAGVLLAFTIPFSARSDDEKSPSHRLEHWLHKPVAFGVLPIFALANTGVLVGATWADELTTPNGLGILGGLVAGKPIGITLACVLAVALGLCRLPGDLRWSHIFGAGMLGGIGFTMSIFIANLAFPADPVTINASKMAILGASLTAGILGYTFLRLLPAGDRPRSPDKGD